METNIPVWAAILIAILSVIGGGFGTWITNYIKTRRELNSADKELQAKLDREKKESDYKIEKEKESQTVVFLKDIINSLKEDLEKLQQEREKEHREYISNREELIKAKMQLEKK